MERTLGDIVDTLRAGKRNRRRCSLLIGAGCSVTAGIPTAAGFVKFIEEHQRSAYGRSASRTYPACMAALDTGVRRDLIVETIRDAKINWAHMAIAQLIKEGWVDRVLTTNFDPLLSRACAMVGEFPAVYDFATSTLFRPAEAAEKAIFHLHGQSTGFVLMNTENECAAHGERLGPLFDDAGRGRSWIVIGYSGENDPVFQRLATVERFEFGLYWIGYLDDEPSPALRSDLLDPAKAKQAYFVKGYDADRFFVELAQKLECFPPRFVERPFTHLRDMLEMLTPFRPPGASSDLDVLDKPRDLLDLAIRQHEPAPGREHEALARDAATPMAHDEPLELALNALLMAGRYADVHAVADRLDPSAALEFEDKFAWAHVLEGNALLERAEAERGEAAEALYREAGETYAEAVRIKPDMHDAFNNWGAALAAWARATTGEAAEALYREAGETYAEAVRIKPDMHEAFYNWGSMLADRARATSGEAAEALYREAGETYAEAVRIKPDMHEAFYNWGGLLLSQARRHTGEAAEALYREAGEKYAEAVRIKPDKHEAFYAWGYALAAWAQATTGEAADTLYREAGEKYAEAVRIKPDMHGAFYNWGLMLAERARATPGEAAAALYREAGEKFAEAVRIKPDKHKALYNWGLMLLFQARRHTGEQATALLNEAEDKLRQAEALKAGGGAYNLACVAALRGQPEECRRWLEVARKHGTLPERPHIEADTDLESVRGCDWFRAFLDSL
ncbi:MAG: hypothetical protein JNM75_03395 [Rhodospirillales bacterium]|nr:hypothetical protein [Rhodospirillales bacterium]